MDASQKVKFLCIFNQIKARNQDPTEIKKNENQRVFCTYRVSFFYVFLLYIDAPSLILLFPSTYQLKDENEIFLFLYFTVIAKKWTLLFFISFSWHLNFCAFLHACRIRTRGNTFQCFPFIAGNIQLFYTQNYHSMSVCYENLKTLFSL